jgi:hypothetical protein
MPSKAKTLQITRIAGQNGEWIDIHHGANGTAYIPTSGYVQIGQQQLLQAIKQFAETQKSK